jgi:hypothetical protein
MEIGHSFDKSVFEEIDMSSVTPTVTQEAVTFIFVCTAFQTMALSTMVSVTNMNTCKTGDLSNQTCYCLDISYETTFNAHPFSENQ